MGYSSIRPGRVSLISAKNRKMRLQWTRGHQNWTIEDLRNDAWFNESRFLLRHADGRVRIWLKQYKSTGPSCLVSRLQAAGDVMVCYELHTKGKWHRRTAIHVLFFNLTVADILVTLVTMCSQLDWEFIDREWIAGEVFCRIFKVFQTFTMVSSNYILLVIAIDRHTAVVYNFFRHTRTKALITCAWALSLLPSLPNA
ncbi:gonadotropin-releasing hormone II receptor-like [Tachypleus tridentatus]|uniref:gonadotropin-releasing hormone II receptor-like n=1 Tax=Tachypleus tridentatus TaxID=6853 RepID=UPI003FD0B82D